MPLSCTKTCSWTLLSRNRVLATWTRTPPEWVNFKALLSRLLRICCRQWIALQKGKWQVCCPAKLECQLFSSAAYANRALLVSSSSSMAKGVDSSPRLPVSILEVQNIIQDPQQGRGRELDFPR